MCMCWLSTLLLMCWEVLGNNREDSLEARVSIMPAHLKGKGVLF